MSARAATIVYRNWKDETKEYVIVPHAASLRFEAVRWYGDKPLWVFDATVTRANEKMLRTFAIERIVSWKACS